ncbi:hypothetical protein FRC03_001281, partial [Tulasnella sp. 419]
RYLRDLPVKYLTRSPSRYSNRRVFSRLPVMDSILRALVDCISCNDCHQDIAAGVVWWWAGDHALMPFFRSTRTLPFRRVQWTGYYVIDLRTGQANPDGGSVWERVAGTVRQSLEPERSCKGRDELL